MCSVFFIHTIMPYAYGPMTYLKRSFMGPPGTIADSGISPADKDACNCARRLLPCQAPRAKRGEGCRSHDNERGNDRPPPIPRICERYWCSDIGRSGRRIFDETSVNVEERGQGASCIASLRSKETAPWRPGHIPQYGCRTASLF